MNGVKNFLTNGWSGWIRITIVIFLCWGSMMAFKGEVLTELKYIRKDFEEHVCASNKLIEKYLGVLAKIEKDLYIHIAREIKEKSWISRGT